MVLYALTFVGGDPEAAAVAARAVSLAGEAGRIKSIARLGPGGHDLLVEADDRAMLAAAAQEAVGTAPVDLCLQPVDGRRKRLLVADMDSTIIGCEGLDELAGYAGVRGAVAAITERAMRGEIEFEPALRQRVATLRGLDAGVLERCYAERIRLNPGACMLVRTLAAHGVRCVLASGGFDVFTSRVAEEAGFAAHHANRLQVTDGKLTGDVEGPIFGRDAKLQALRSHAEELGVEPEAALAIGDGANDLAMIRAAGLGVAYRAKPIVAAGADMRLDHADLSALLYVQGYSHEAFMTT